MDDKSKYYGTVTELQEIRKAMKYLATSVDNLVQQQRENSPKAVAEQLTLRFEATVSTIVTDAISSIEPQGNAVIYANPKAQLYNELKRYQKQYRWSRTNEEKERLRGLINSVMYEINNY
jgi:hypothetical protein